VSQDKIRAFETRYLSDKKFDFNVGDTVVVHYRTREAGKERVQPFRGTVIRRSGGGLRETFTVRKMVADEGVERVFPLHSPNLVGVEVERHGLVRRARLYYLRDRVGKATRVKERIVSRDRKTKRTRKRRGRAGARKRVEEPPPAGERSSEKPTETEQTAEQV